MRLIVNLIVLNKGKILAALVRIREMVVTTKKCRSGFSGRRVILVVMS